MTFTGQVMLKTSSCVLSTSSFECFIPGIKAEETKFLLMPFEQNKALRDPIAQSSSYQDGPYDPAGARNKGNSRAHSNEVEVQEEKG